MALQPGQYKILHVAARKLKLIDGKDKARYLMLLDNVAGVESSTDLNNKTFEDVMAVIEGMGFNGRDAVPPEENTSTYWRDKVERRGLGFANERSVHLIKRLAEESNYNLYRLCKNFSDNAAEIPERLTPGQAWKLIEMLKASNDRKSQKATVTEDRHVQARLF